MCDLNVGDRVICISDRSPCCQRKIPDFVKLMVGDGYTITEIGIANCTTCNTEVVGVAVPGFSDGYAADHRMFKRIPPAVIKKFKKVPVPVST